MCYNPGMKIRLPENKFLKVFILFWGVVLGLYFLPFIIGGFLIYFVYKNSHNLIIRNSILAAIILPTLLFGGIWVAGLTKGATDQTPVVTPTPTPFPTATPSPTLIPTPTSTPSATPSGKVTQAVRPTLSPGKVSTPSPTYHLVVPTKAKFSPTPIPIYDPPASTNTSTNTSASGDKNCSDFPTHADAQSYFTSHGGSPSNNVDGLDRDHDGIACETLP